MLEKFKKLKVNIGWKSLVFIGVCVVLILVDLLTKIFEEKYNWNFTVIPKLIEVESGSRNPGCAFSFLADAAWGQTFLIVMTFIMLAVLIAVFVVLPEKFILLKVSISMITAGAIGNLIDRIAFREVRDFVGLNMFGNMVSCNFADFWIVIGTIIAVIDILFINEWALIPLTKSAKAAQANKKQENEKTEITVQTSEYAEIKETENTKMQVEESQNAETQESEAPNKEEDNKEENNTDENNG